MATVVNQMKAVIKVDMLVHDVSILALIMAVTSLISVRNVLIPTIVVTRMIHRR